MNAALELHAKANDINNKEDDENDEENVVIRMPAIAATVAHDKAINGVAVSPNHLLVASASAGSHGKALEDAGFALRWRLSRHKRRVGDCIFRCG